MKKIRHYKIKILCGLLYTFCLLQILGISVYYEEKKESVTKLDDAIAFVSSSMVEEPPKIAITFDDGPSSQCTGRLLDGLKERNVKATFFLIGENAKENPELVKRLDEEGHLIGNHTYSHVQLTGIPEEEACEELLKTSREVEIITGEHLEYVRPPFGSWNDRLDCDILMIPVLWSVDSRDWTTTNVSEIVQRVVTQARENDIILMHDYYASSVEAALQIVDQLKERGYEFVTADELIVN